MITQQEFIDNEGAICPMCGSTDVDLHEEFGDYYGDCLECDHGYDIVRTVTAWGAIYDYDGNAVNV